MNSPAPLNNKMLIFSAITFLFLFAGFGRIFSLTLHDPILAYANNYEMLQIQACHQIWPADTNIKAGQGSVTAPLRDYTFSKYVETPCFPSSELLFTSLGIQLAKIQNYFSQNDTISIQTIGFTKALCLIFIALAAHIFFFCRRNAMAMATNTLCVFIVLSDPGITLYFNTFYTEFSAVFFMYVILAGIAILIIESWRLVYSLPLLVGLLGFGFSKIQHMPLLSCLGFLLALSLLITKQRWLALAILLCTVTPYTLQTFNYYVPQNENMVAANKINVMGSALEAAKNPQQLLASLNLPKSCLNLSGKNWYTPIVQKNKICFELKEISHLKIASALLKKPSIISAMFWKGLSRLKIWIIQQYGQVESERLGNSNMYYGSITELLASISDGFFATLLLAPLIAASAGFLFSVIRKPHGALLIWSGILLLSLLPLGIYGEALLESGLVDLSKKTHLVVPLTLFIYVLLFTYAGSRIAKSSQPNSGL